MHTPWELPLEVLAYRLSVHTFLPTRNSVSSVQAPQAQFLTMLSHGVRTGAAVAT